MKLFLHDDTPAAPGEKHGPEGPTHAGTVRFEYGHGEDLSLSDEIEQVAAKSPWIVRIVCPDLHEQDGARCEWAREGRFFVGQGPRARQVDGLARRVRSAAGMTP